jgi:hypothetical protein
MLEKNIALSLIQVCFIACVNSTLTILLTYIRSVIHKVNIFEGNVVNYSKGSIDFDDF